MKIYDYKGKKNVCADKVFEARRRLKMTQDDLAMAFKNEGILLEQDSISRMELGLRFVTDYEIRALSKILNVSVNWLLGVE